MKFTKLLLTVFIVSLCFGQLGSLPLSEGVTLYVSDILAILLLLVWLTECLLIQRRIVLDLTGWSLLLFNFAALITLVIAVGTFSISEITVGGLYWLRWVLYSSLYFLATDVVKKRPPDSTIIIKLLIASGVGLALAGFVQLLLVPDFRYFAVEYGWDPHRGRLLSTFFDPNFTAAYLVIAITLVMATIIGSRRKSFLVVVLSILLLALLLTFSRSGWLMLGLTVSVVGLLRAKWLLALALLLAFSAYFFVPRVQTRLSGVTDPADSAHFRLLSWKNTLRIANDFPLAGVGFNTFRYAQARYGYFDYKNPLGGHAGAGSDSSWLLVLATTGYLGGFLFVIIYVMQLIRSWRMRKTPSGLALLAVIIGLVVEANFINSLFYTPVTASVWLLAGSLNSYGDN